MGDEDVDAVTVLVVVVLVALLAVATGGRSRGCATLKGATGTGTV